MNALFGKRPIMVTAELVRALGANHAIVLQQVAWWSIESRKAQDGWIVMTMKNLSASTGLSPDAVRRSLKRLRDDGYIEAEGDERQVLAFSITDKAWAITGAESPQMKSPSAAESPQSLVRNRRSTAAESPQKSARTTYRDNGEDKTEDARPSFEQFWEAYPKRNGQTRGPKQSAIDKWVRMAPADRSLAFTACPIYTEAIDPAYYKDAVRFLTHRIYDDYQHPAPKKMTDAERFIAKVHAQEEAERAAAAPIAEIEEW